MDIVDRGSMVPLQAVARGHGVLAFVQASLSRQGLAPETELTSPRIRRSIEAGSRVEPEGYDRVQDTGSQARRLAGRRVSERRTTPPAAGLRVWEAGRREPCVTAFLSGLGLKRRIGRWKVGPRLSPNR